MFRSAHTATENLTAIKIVFSNFYNCINAGGLPIIDTGRGAASTITAAVEYNGISTRLLFSGSSSGSIPDVSTLASDYLTIPGGIPSGATFWIRLYTTNSVGIIFNSWQNSSLGECFQVGSSGISDVTGSTGTFTNGAGWSCPPLAILGMTTNPSVIIVCDSVAAGQTQTEDAAHDGKIGFIATNIGNIPFVVIGRSGARCLLWNTTATAANAIIQKSSHIILNLGANDILNDSKTAAQTLAGFSSIFALARAGQKIYLTTLSPWSNSVNGWIAPQDQTIRGSNTERNNFNTAIRAGISGATGFYDTAPLYEASAGNFQWPVIPSPPYTADGVHMTVAGAALAAGSISSVVWP